MVIPLHYLFLPFHTAATNRRRVKADIFLLGVNPNCYITMLDVPQMTGCIWRRDLDLRLLLENKCSLVISSKGQRSVNATSLYSAISFSTCGQTRATNGTYQNSGSCTLLNPDEPPINRCTVMDWPLSLHRGNVKFIIISNDSWCIYTGVCYVHFIYSTSSHFVIRRLG